MEWGVGGGAVQKVYGLWRSSSGVGRKEFCTVHGLSVHTLDAWRRRIAQAGSQEKIVPVEIVEEGLGCRNSMRAPSPIN